MTIKELHEKLQRIHNQTVDLKRQATNAAKKANEDKLSLCHQVYECDVLILQDRTNTLRSVIGMVQKCLNESNS